MATTSQFAEAGPIDSVDPILDRLIEQGSKAAGQVSAATAEKILAEIVSDESLFDATLLPRIEGIIARQANELADTIGDALVAANATGAAEAAVNLTMPVVDMPGSPAAPLITAVFPSIDDAVDTLRDAELFAGRDFRATAAAAKRKAFAITSDLKTETVGDIRDILQANLARGPSAAEFERDIKELLGEGTGLSDARLNMVFRNNMGATFGDAMDRGIDQPLVADAFPYRRYLATGDQRARAEHIALESRGLDGTDIYNASDPVWRLFRPPWDYGCRCSFSPVTVEQAAGDGVLEAQAWIDRAQGRAELLSGSAASHLADAAPGEFEFVGMPEFQPSPEFRRDVGI